MTIPGPTPGNLIDTIDALVAAANASSSPLAGVLGLSSVITFEENIVIVPFQAEGVYKSLGVGPLFLGVGSSLTVFVGAPTASDLSIDQFIFEVSNAAGTELLRLTLTLPALAINGGYWAPVDVDWTTALLVGTDLTIASGGIRSAAGGQFFATIFGQFGLTAP